MSVFSGSLAGKRKADLVEIAEAIGIVDASNQTMVTLREGIQTRLDAESDRLKLDPQFKGLYVVRSRRNHTEDSDSPDLEKPSATARARKSITRTIDRLVEAANTPLPDSPVKAAKEATEAAVEATEDAIALVDHESESLVQTLQHYSDEVVKFIDPAIHHTEGHWRNARDTLSQPDNLLIASLVLEAAALYHQVAPFNHYTGNAAGSFGALFESAFSWAPSFSWTVGFPRHQQLLPSSDLWPAFGWWFCTTVAPPLLLSTLVSFVPQKGVHNRGRMVTRYQSANPPTPTVDTLTYAIFRWAILLLPFFDAAPRAFVDALDASGDAQMRALAGGIFLGLVLAQRLTA